MHIRHILIADVDRTIVVANENSQLCTPADLVNLFKKSSTSSCENYPVSGVYLCTHRYAEIHKLFLKNNMQKYYPTNELNTAHFLTFHAAHNLITHLGLTKEDFFGVCTPEDKILGVGETFNTKMLNIETELARELIHTPEKFMADQEQIQYDLDKFNAEIKAEDYSTYFSSADKNGMILKIIEHDKKNHPFEGTTHYHFVDDIPKICDAAVNAGIPNLSVYQQDFCRGEGISISRLFPSKKRKADDSLQQATTKKAAETTPPGEAKTEALLSEVKTTADVNTDYANALHILIQLSDTFRQANNIPHFIRTTVEYFQRIQLKNSTSAMIEQCIQVIPVAGDALFKEHKLMFDEKTFEDLTAKAQLSESPAPQ